MEYTLIPSSELKNHGKVVGKTIYLEEGVHTRFRKKNPKNELFVSGKRKEEISMKKRNLETV